MRLSTDRFAQIALSLWDKYKLTAPDAHALADALEKVPGPKSDDHLRQIAVSWLRST